MAPPLLMLTDIHLTLGGRVLLDHAALAVSAGDRICLVGRNGSGKSTLLKIAAGLIAPEGGEAFVQPGTSVRYLAQEPDLAGFATTLDYVLAGLGAQAPAWRAQTMLEQLGLSGTENPASLSGGEARRCALARALAPEPDVLLLDEPTNHLDLPAIEWLEAELAGMRSAMVLVSHDRRYLEALSKTTVWLSEGATHRLERGFAEFETWRDDFVDAQEQQRHKLDRKIAAETEWLHKGVTARRKRNQGRLRALYSLRAERRARSGPAAPAAMEATRAALSGKLVAEAEGVTKAYDGRAVVADFSTRILRGDRVGIIGPNGAGKTTLLNLLTGALAPDSGSIRLGTNLAMVTMDQKRESLDADETLAEVLTGGGGDTVTVGTEKRHVIGYMKDFLFSPDQARTPVGKLSGGERARLMLARALAKPSNLLVLDEPTNDLDLETLDLLQEMLADYAGTVLLVSHDRDFLDRSVTSVIAWEGGGTWLEYAGGYSDMVTQRGRGVDARGAASGRKDRLTPTRGAAGGKAASGSPGKRRLSFKDKHALETLPKRMAACETEIERHRAALADPGLYARDPARYQSAAAALADAEHRLAAMEEEWLVLELAREEAEGG